MTDEPDDDFREDGFIQGNEPEWYQEMIRDGHINVVHNAMIATLGFTAEELDHEGNIHNVVRGEDFAIVFETDHPEVEHEQVRALFTVTPPGALAIAHMILRRFPAEVVAQIAYEATARPGPLVNAVMSPAVPPSEEGMNFIREQLNKRAKGYDTDG